MSWFKVDDTAHSHPKLRSAGTAAIGLWTLGGSYAAQYLTDGMVHSAFVKMNGTAPQIARLVKARLWHPARHDCDRCVQPADGDYVIHDYLDYNPSRARVLAERKKAADKKRSQRGGQGSDGGGPSGIPPRTEEESKRNRPRIEEESSEIASPDSAEIPGQLDLSLGDTNGPRAGAARPDPVVPSKEGTTAGMAARTNGVPDRLRPLARGLSAAGLGAVAWDISKIADWERIRIQLDRLGVDLMVESALTAATRRGKPDSVTAWIGRWETLEDPQPQVAVLPTGAGANVYPITAGKPSTTDQRVGEAYALAQELRALEGGNPA